MKNILLFFITLCLKVPVNAQSLLGKWKISHLITERTIDEYIIYKPEEERSYGNHLSINESGTFSTHYTAECGNDCFTTTSGTYKMIDENHIRFFIKNISHSGECEGNSNPNKDIGLYYIHREENRIQLLKSDGNIEKDKQNVIYSKMIADFLNFERTIRKIEPQNKRIEKTSEKDAINAYLSELGYTDFGSLFSKPIESYGRSIILVRIEQKHQYLYLADMGKSYYISLYDFDYDFIKETDLLVDKINSDKELKAININEASFPHSGDDFNLLTVFTKTEKKSVEKIIHQEFNKYYELTTIYYLVNETPIYIEQNYDMKRASDRPVQNAFYIVDWNINKYILKKMNLGSRKFEKEKFEKIIELSKEKIKN